MNKKMKSVFAAAVLSLGLLSATANAGGHYGFSFSTGPAFVPAPVVVAPPPPPVVVYRPAYPVYYGPMYRPGPSFSFSYHGH